MDVKKIRKDFPILEREVNGKPLVYFDNAATSQTPVQVIETITDYYKNYNANIHRGVHALSQEATDVYEASRRKIQKHFNAAQPHEIIFTGPLQHQYSKQWIFSFAKEGDELIVSAMEHHSNIVPWQMFAKKERSRSYHERRWGFDHVRIRKLLSDKTNWCLSIMSQMPWGRSIPLINHSKAHAEVRGFDRRRSSFPPHPV